MTYASRYADLTGLNGSRLSFTYGLRHRLRVSVYRLRQVSIRRFGLFRSLNINNYKEVVILVSNRVSFNLTILLNFSNSRHTPLISYVYFYLKSNSFRLVNWQAKLGYSILAQQNHPHSKAR